MQAVQMMPLSGTKLVLWFYRIDAEPEICFFTLYHSCLRNICKGSILHELIFISELEKVIFKVQILRLFAVF